MAPSEKNQYPVNVTLQRLLIVLSATGTLLILGWLIKYSAYGIDFTDEGFYLTWISNPFIYNFSLTQFGFIYHPIFRLVGGDITALRQSNILIIFGLAWGLVYIFLNSLAPESRKNYVVLHTAAAGLATSAFTIFNLWLPTPSYNSLTLQALLITGIGLLLANKTATRKSISGWITIGIGGWLAFMAKPSTALALTAGVLIYLVLSRKFSIRLLLLAATSTAVLLMGSALLIDGSVFRFVERLLLGVEFGKRLGGGHTLSQILRIDDFQLGRRHQLAILLVLSACFLAVWGAWTERRKGAITCLSLSFVIFTVTALLAFGEIHQGEGLGQFQGLLIFGVVFGAALAGLILGRINALKSITATQWAVGFLFLAMPHIYAFGTNGNYWQAGSSAAIFWLLSGLTLLGPLVRERASMLLVLPLALATQAVTATLLQAGLEQPYRQPQPLRLNATPLEVGPKRSPLVLSESYAKYLHSAVVAARNAGFEPATPMIDLTGQSPGILYALGAESIGQAWNIGGYSGSLNRAVAALSFVDCVKIASSWIILEPNGPLSISEDVLLMHGINFPNDYKIVGKWFSAKGAGGYSKEREQFLYAPLNHKKNIQTCRIKRGE